MARSLLPEHVGRFLDRMEGAAHRASEQTGMPKRLILAQAALETGWGRHETRTADGDPSHNVFNIKATGWQGESTQIRTTEFENGQSYKTDDAFRVYDNYEQAFSDYARLMRESPRYAPVMNAADAESAARALQDCGYATDPAYADKLVSIMRRLPADSAAAQPVNAQPAARAVEVSQRGGGAGQVTGHGAGQSASAGGIAFGFSEPAPGRLDGRGGESGRLF